MLDLRHQKPTAPATFIGKKRTESVFLTTARDVSCRLCTLTKRLIMRYTRTFDFILTRNYTILERSKDNLKRSVRDLKHHCADWENGDDQDKEIGGSDSHHY